MNDVELSLSELSKLLIDLRGLAITPHLYTNDPRRKLVDRVDYFLSHLAELEANVRKS